LPLLLVKKCVSEITEVKGRVVHELEMQVRLGRVARVPAGRQLLAGGDPVARPHPDRPTAQVGQGGVDLVAQVEHDVVAEDPARPEQLAKEEAFFAEDERLLAVIDETLDGAPDGEPVLDLARRATRALAAHSAADPQRRLARERLIAATPALQARRLAKTLRWEQAIAARLVARGSSDQEALLVPKVALACFQSAYERWVRDPARTCRPWSTRASPPCPA
jgi:MftR C-terminal domain